jgi:hypothetical protein
MLVRSRRQFRVWPNRISGSQPSHPLAPSIVASTLVPVPPIESRKSKFVDGSRAAGTPPGELHLGGDEGRLVQDVVDSGAQLVEAEDEPRSAGDWPGERSSTGPSWFATIEAWLRLLGEGGIEDLQELLR